MHIILTYLQKKKEKEERRYKNDTHPQIPQIFTIVTSYTQRALHGAVVSH
jgi:hypothetical protein